MASSQSLLGRVARRGCGGRIPQRRAAARARRGVSSWTFRCRMQFGQNGSGWPVTCSAGSGFTPVAAQNWPRRLQIFCTPVFAVLLLKGVGDTWQPRLAENDTAVSFRTESGWFSGAQTECLMLRFCLDCKLLRVSANKSGGVESVEILTKAGPYRHWLPSKPFCSCRDAFP